MVAFETVSCKGLAVGAAALLLSVAAKADTYYVDPENGNDAYDGTAAVWAGGSSKVGPKETLVGVMSVAKAVGDVVSAAEGRYTNGTIHISASSGMKTGKYRVSIPQGVWLVASGAQDKTIIEGEPHPGAALTESPWGCGADAVRGVYLNDKAVVKGFTITKCYAAPDWGSSYYGGGANGAGYVIDCKLTGNVAPRGAGMSGPTAIRCRFTGNKGNWSGTDMMGGDSFCCHFSNCQGGANVHTGFHYNDLYTDEGTSLDSSGTGFFNCLMRKMCSNSTCMMNCLTTYPNQERYGTLGEGSEIVTVAAMALSSDNRPKRTSVAVNRGVDSYYEAAFPSDDLPGEKDFDLDGKPRKVGTTIDVGPYECQNPCPGHFYVDAEKGNDANDGETPATAMQSLAAACALNTLLSGDTIHAAPGVYSNKTQTVSSEPYRCVVPAGVKLVASGSREETIIEGAPAEGVSLTESPWGCGTGAIRGVYLGEKAQVRGFTIRKCYGPAFSSSTYGAATVGYGYVIDCHLTGNVSGRGAALSSTTAVRCLINGNRGGWTGADSQGANAYNSVFGDYAGSYNTSHGLYCNCTFYGNDTADGAGTSAGDGLYNCLILKKSGAPSMAVHSICTGTSSGLGPDSRYIASSAVKVDGFVPYRSSPAVNGGSNDLYATTFPAADLPDEVNRDFFGNVRIVGATIDVGAVECASSETPLNLYVDASKADDSGDGLSPETAKKTLAAAVCSLDLIPGDAVHVAEGFYDEGAVTNGTPYRVVVPEGVTVVADAGRNRTFIVGAEDQESTHALKYGPNAVRCVYLNENALLIGFCLTNGIVSAAADCGGGANGAASGCLVDCEIVGCKAYRGGGVTSVRAVRCLFHDNVTDYTGCDVFSGGGFYGCVFGRGWKYDSTGLSDTSAYSIYAGTCDFINCTFYGPGSFTSGGVGGGLYFRNCIFDCDGMGGVHIRNSVRTSRWGLTDDVVDCFVTNATALALDGEKRPGAGSAAIDRGDNGCLDLVPESLRKWFLCLDDAENQRIYNATVDLGAYEYDWRGDYAKRLSRCATVSRATTNVIMSAEGPSVTDGQSMEGTLAAQAGRTYLLKPSMSGEGDLTVLADGEPLVAEDGVYKFVAGPSDRTIAWEVRFDGAGSATLSRFRSNAGLLLLVR